MCTEHQGREVMVCGMMVCGGCYLDEMMSTPLRRFTPATEWLGQWYNSVNHRYEIVVVDRPEGNSR